MGCFGEPLLKKFGAEPPEEWVLGMGSLDSRQIARGMRRIVFGWKGGPPNLPDFMRLCRSLGDTEFDAEPQRAPQVTHEDAGLDRWEREGNRRLLAYIVAAAGSRRYFTAEQTAALVAAKKAWAADMRDIDRGEGVPPDAQKTIWNDYLGLAKSEPKASGLPQ